LQTHQRLLTALLLVTFIPLLIYFSVGLAVQKDILENFQEVGGELLPGNIATARTMTELYHILYMTEQYAAGRDNNDKEKIEALIANLDVHVAMHMLYHGHTHSKLDAEKAATIIHRFSSFTSEYILLIEKNVPQEELHLGRMKIDKALGSFVSMMNPLIDIELEESSNILKESRQKNTKVFRFMVGFGLLTLFLSLSISFFISRRFRAVDKENENFKNNLQSLVAKRTSQLHEKNIELENEILERKKIEEELRSSERTLQSVLDSVIPICITDIDFNILKANKSYYEIWPFSKTEIDRLKCYESRHGTLCDTDLCPLLQIKNGQQEVSIEVQKSDSGQQRDFIVTARPFFDTTGELIGIVESFQEITKWKKVEAEKTKLEQELRQAQKMESIGTLASGIAHDFNNILSPIYGYTEMALLLLSDNHKAQSYLNHVLKAAYRAKELAKQILTFSRQETQKQSPLELQSIIKEALKLLRASIPTTIEIRRNIDPQCRPVLANPTQLHQVLMNLCTNAYHAMREKGGILGVSLIPYTVTREDIVKNVNLRPGSYVRLEVSDNGQGMDEQTLGRIFEPYFTTKGPGEGTGMGLSVSHGIIKSHRGHISVYSEPGQGTTFHIYLPVIEETVLPFESISTETLPTGDEKIMLIDDEETTLDVEKEVLTTLGYDVSDYNNPLDALEYFRHHTGKFDIIITDMTMPRMTGDKLAAAIKALRPEIPVIICTGFADILSKEKTKEIGIAAFLTKPVPIKDFAMVVRKALDQLS
jgi:PAS domain S-box-containing protein